ncbi:electron transport complex subunit RsxD [Alteromonas pelagimontana]|uniref:Ion-translocating oxidoreductase complex subunit D n=1 Tax=Alteromonas pelagimontana TaxID=1858656 RepID=A0A6M4M9S3_9ALTE|nr:electron transport complex subunit RsxD [Alteromonas pelagimontana]QJR79894.1 electron transport complex subunit RsxD [Alteromonas pelagimontana]
MKLMLSSSPHQHVKRNTGQVMRLVIYAMIPGIVAQLYFFGWGVFIQAVIAVTTAIVTEATILSWRKKNVPRALGDCSAIVTALLLAVSIPPLLPWWMTVIGTFFAIAIVKQVYGGLGYNMFNPAMIAYVALLISFPAAMTGWLSPVGFGFHSLGLVDAISTIVTGFTTEGYNLEQLKANVDGFTMATPLDAVKTGLTQGMTYSEALAMPIFDGGFAQSVGAGWAWVSVAYLAGGLLLINRRVISWNIPGSMIVSVIVCALVLHLMNQDHYASPLFHLFNGSLIIGAFFIATDPVSASTTAKGRIVFGALIGFWIVIIRTFGGYPDAVAFAVIIMNMAVPLIDYYTRPRTYGHGGTARKSVEETK